MPQFLNISGLDDVRADGGFVDKKKSDAFITERGDFRHHFGVNESTIRFIMKNEGKFRGSVKSGVPTGAKVSCVKADSHIACHAHAVPMPFVNSYMPCRAPALLLQCRAFREIPRGSRKYPNW